MQKVPAASPAGPVPGGRPQSGSAGGACRPPSLPAVVVSDEQITALVTAAGALGRRQRDRCADAGSAAADARLLRLDWAVRAGRLALSERVARLLTSAAAPAQRPCGDQ